MDPVKTAQLMKMNQLKYEMPANMSVATQGAVFKKHSADQQTYSSTSGTEMIITLQSSTDFVYGKNCYLRFDVACQGAESTAGAEALLGFLNSPATALFERYLLETKSGDELERVEDVNKAVRNILPWRYPQSYRRTCEMAGQRSSKTVTSGITTQSDLDASFGVDSKINDPTTEGTKLRVCIPLWYFSGLFNEETLLPPSLISGARFRLSLAPALEAISIIASVGGVAPGGYVDPSLQYTISDPVIMMDTYSLDQNIQENIMELAGSAQGLPYVYQSLYAQRANPGTNTGFVVQINKAVARAQKLWTITQQVLADSSTRDNLGSRAFDYFQVQTRVGDLYLPQQVLQCGTSALEVNVTRNCAELFANNLQCTRGLRDPYFQPSVSLEDFRISRGVSAVEGNGGSAVLVQTLNQSSHISESGIAINNSRTAEVRIEYASNHGDTQAVLSFLQYTKAAAVFADRTVIKQ